MDECGDHSLAKIDKDFPLFVLSTVIFERVDYVNVVVPALTRLKLRFWSHEGVNLHSRDIRKQLGDFAFLRQAPTRQEFLDAMNELIQSIPFALFITAVNKRSHLDKHGPSAHNPYEWTLGFTLRRMLDFLRHHNEEALPIIAESRGFNEDSSLAKTFFAELTPDMARLSKWQFDSTPHPPIFRKKSDNIAGLQVADLCAHPCARKMLNPDQPNRAFDIVYSHIYRRDAVVGWEEMA